MDETKQKYKSLKECSDPILESLSNSLFESPDCFFPTPLERDSVQTPLERFRSTMQNSWLKTSEVLMKWTCHHLPIIFSWTRKERP